MHGHRGSGRRCLRAGARRAYQADDLVTEDEWFTQPELADRAVPPVVQVGAADPAVADVDRHLAGAGHRHRPLLHAQVARPVGHDRSHRR